MNPLINGLFKQFQVDEELHQMSDADAFELFAAKLILPDDLLGQIATTDLFLDEGTPGVDIAILEINGQIAWDPTDVEEICGATSRIEVSLHLIQAKRSASVDSSDILNFGDLATSILLGRPLLHKHSKIVAISAALRSIFANHVKKLRGQPTVQLSFATTASRASVSDAVVLDRKQRVEEDIANLDFVQGTFSVLGADDLHDAWRRKNNANEVEIQFEKQVNLPKMPGIDQAILGVVSVGELLKLIQDSNGVLDERVFYDNVRGFKGRDNSVNKQILATLATAERSLLPVLNNGVTVVASAYAPKPGDSVAISGFQIVNGCQTSHCLYLSRDELSEEMRNVYVPIRLVVTDDAEVAIRIIRATNSQTEVGENDLVALTNFQKKLEDYYKLDPSDVKLTYERRSGQFYDREVTKTRVLTISDQMRAVSAMFLEQPHAASRYPQSLYSEIGESIFREDHRLPPYVASAFAAYRLENAFRAGLNPKFKPARYHILATCRYLITGSRPSPLNGLSAEKESTAIIAALKKPDHVDLFRSATEHIIETGGGQIPSPDRLKRQQFTSDLLRDVRQRQRGR